MRLDRALFVIACALGIAHPAVAGVDARMFRYPDVSDSQMCFVYAGDIWVVAKDGGTAHRLSSPPGEESFPRFSPDGSKIAFSANYDGNTDVYMVSAGGGVPHRITYHPEVDRLLDWTPDGESLLFASRRGLGAYPRLNQIYRVSAAGGPAERLPMPYGEFGALSPDGKVIAYTPKSRGFRTWKRYRGGMAPEIWLLDLQTLAARNVSSSPANDTQPMWHGDTLYFLSDRGPRQRANIWAVDLGAGDFRQVTHFTEFDITFPAVGPGELVFQAGGRLHLMDLETEAHREVGVEVLTDLATLRPHTVKVSDLIANAHVSPSGKRAVIEARGELYTLPREHGVVRQLTRSSGAAERYPAWSPDGEHVAYFSDASGEYELTIRPSGGAGDEVMLTGLGPGYRYRPFWSPDSTKIAFIGHAQRIMIVNRETRQVTAVDRALWMLHPGLEEFEVSWSADSRWLAYSRGIDTGIEAVFLFDTPRGELHRVTSGYYNDSRPVFDPDGKYLYYLSNRSLEPIYSDLDATWVYPNTTRVVAVPLRGDVPSPLAPRNDEEEADAENGDDGEADDEKGKKDRKKDRGEKKAGGEDACEGDDGADDEGPEPVEIDLEGLEERAVVLPPEAGNYGTLRAVAGKVLFHRLPRTGTSSGARPVVFFDLEEREEKTVIANASGYEISADGEKMLVAANGSFAIVDVAPGQKIEKELAISRLETVVDPRREWRQMFNDIWRAYRDYFYDPGLHGVDWELMREHYGALLEDAVTRWDVNFVLGELIGEVNASHTYVGGGETETPRRRRVGMLGVDWALENGAYRVARIVRGAPWDAETRSPLLEPGIDLSEGDYVLAVNGSPLDPAMEPYAAFEGLAEETVVLAVNHRPTLDGAREVLVKTLGSEEDLRYHEWIESNRRRVDEASGGRVGYIFVPNTSISGQTELVRQLASQVRREGLVIDERFNAGGQLPDRFIEQMNRKMVTRIALRHGATRTVPAVTHYGPKAMLINGWAGSGGDAFPYFFKELGVGPIIGERTWGGLIGPAIRHSLIDGGRYTAPSGRLFGPDGAWFPEGHGVDPDIVVVDDPGELAQGRDPQLEAAIAEVLRLLETDPPVFPEPPPFERRVAGEEGEGESR